MKQAIDFVKYAILAQSVDTGLTLLHSTGGFLQSYNGVVACQHPVDDLPEFSVASSAFIRAAAVCDYSPKVIKTDTDVLIKKGSFSARVPTQNYFVEKLVVKGKKYKVDKNLVEKIKRLLPYISDDASREWSQTVLIKDGFMYATNNIVAIRLPVQSKVDMVIPIEVMNPLVKSAYALKDVWITDSQIGFNFGKGRLMSCGIPVNTWPKGIEKMFKKLKKPKKIDPKLRAAISDLAWFAEDDIIAIMDGKVWTYTAEIKGFKIPNITLSCSNIKKVLDIFTTVSWPKKGDGIIRFTGDGDIEGVMATVFSNED